MGLDRYLIATEMLEQGYRDLGVQGCFEILKRTAQTACPTVVTMVFDVAENTVYWCERMQWDEISQYKMT